MTTPTQESVAIGNWHKLDAAGDWTFRPASRIDHLEVTCYDSLSDLTIGRTPFSRSSARSSGAWPDGPENDAGELGHEVQPHVLGDGNTHLYGKLYYRSLRLYGGSLWPDSVYQVSFSGPSPPHIWVHPLRASAFTMPAAVQQSSEASLQTAAWGPATVTRTPVDADSTRFAYAGLRPDAGTGLKDNFPVQNYGQRAGSHGNGDFGWFCAYTLRFHNEGPGSVHVALFVNTGFTGASGAPSNDWRNDTFWKSPELYLSPAATGVVGLDFDAVTGWNLADNPFPHTAGGQGAANGSSGVAINVFDRLQVSAIGWEVRSGTGGTTDVSLVLSPCELPVHGTPVDAAEPRGSFTHPPRLLRVVPNPFNPSTVITFELPATAGKALLEVYDAAGRHVRTLVDRPLGPGVHAAAWNGRDDAGRAVASGTYYASLRVHGHAAPGRKLTLVR